MKTLLIMVIITLIHYAQQDTIKNYNLGEIVVTSEQNALVKSSSVFDLNLEQIEIFNTTNITSPLKFSTGLFITTTSKNESKIYMRGYDQRQIAIFLDGVPIYEPYSGLIDLSNLPVCSFEKINVSKGMPSIGYGANSMAGSINFITKRSQKRSISVNVESGSFNNFNFGTSGSYENFYYNVNAGYTNSTGFKIPSIKENFLNENGGKRDNSQYENIGGMIKLGMTNLYNFNIAYSFMLINNQKGVPTDVYTKNPRYWRYTEWNKLINNLMFSRTIGTNIRVKGNVFHESYNNVLDSYDDDSFMSQEMKYAFRSSYDDHSFGINLISDVEFLNTGITRLSFAWKKDVHKEEGNFNSGFSRYEASVLSSGIEQDINLSQSISAVLGFSYDLLTPIFADNSELRSKTNSLNYLAGINYRTSKSLSFNLNASKKSRFPTLKEFYSETVGRDLANPNLTIEQSLNSEIGFTYSLKSNIEINSSLFYSSIDDLINQVFLGEGLRQFQNIGKAEIKGLEIGLNYNNDNYNFNLAYTYLSARNLSENRESSKLENRPEHILSLFTDYNFLFGTQIRGEFLFIANKIGIDSDTRKFVKMDDYLLTNIKISHDYLNNYLVYFRVNNLFNIYYESDYGYPQQGIEFIIGLKANF